MGTNISQTTAFHKADNSTTILNDLNYQPDRSALDFSEFPVWNATTLTHLVGDNPPMHLRLLEKFLASAQNQVDIIHSAAASGDTVTLHKVAHALKSAARTVGTMQLGELCHEIESAGKTGNIKYCITLAAQLNDVFEAAAEKIKHILN